MITASGEPENYKPGDRVTSNRVRDHLNKAARRELKK